MAQGGTASLVLTEIPHRTTAYILLRTVLPGQLENLIAECAGFCRSCGAEQVLVSREQESLPLPHAYDLLHLRVDKSNLPSPETSVPLIPINPDNDVIYQRIYNLCFQSVSHALTYDRAQLQRIYQLAQQAFLAMDENGNPCGIGELHGNELAAVGLLPEYRGQGRSRDLMLTLLSLCPGPELTLRLYDNLGFTVCGRDSIWYYTDP